MVISERDKEVSFLEFFFLSMVYLTKWQTFGVHGLHSTCTQEIPLCRDTGFRAKQKLNTGYVKAWK